MGNTDKMEVIHFAYGFYSLQEIVTNTSIKEEELNSGEVIVFAERNEIFLDMGHDFIAIMFYPYICNLLKYKNPFLILKSPHSFMSHRILGTID